MAVFDLIGRHAVPRNAVIEKPCYLRHVERTGNHQNFVYPAFVRHVIDGAADQKRPRLYVRHLAVLPGELPVEIHLARFAVPRADHLMPRPIA